MNYQDIREKTPVSLFRDVDIISSIVYLWSPYISMLFIREKIRPNTITLMMIISGVIGGVLLMMPNLYCKIAASIIYIIWYTFDLSDGEVARFTKVFSRGGKYLDWCAHLAAHSLFAVGMWSTFVYMGYDVFVTSILTFLLISCELISRNCLSLYSLYYIDEDNKSLNTRRKSILKYLYSSFTFFPGMIIIHSILVCLAIIFEIQQFYWIYFVWALLYSIVAIRVFVLLICRIY